MTVRDRLLDILSDRWQSRGEIATRLGRPKPVLASHDLNTLNALVFMGKAEKRTTTYHGVQTRWEYRKVQK